jgi:hypothetical protein
MILEMNIGLGYGNRSLNSSAVTTHSQPPHSSCTIHGVSEYGFVLGCLPQQNATSKPLGWRPVTHPCASALTTADYALRLQALSLPTYGSFDKLRIDDVGARNALKEVGSCSHAKTMFDHGLTMV